MDTQQDLATASREALLALITQLRSTVMEQEAAIAQLQRRTAELEARLNTRGSPGMPGNKPSARQRSPRKEARKGRAHGFARVRMAPTQRVEHAVEVCPDCGTPLAGGWVQRTREVIEVPVVPVQVTEHVFIARVCPVCQRRRVPQVNLKGVVAGQQRFGVNLVSLIVTLREEGRLPLRTIQWYLQTVHQLQLSVGGIVRVIHGVAQQAQGAVAEVLEQVRASPVVQADETGWREDGANGYVWTFSTPTERYFLRRGRGKAVVDEVLDESFGGVLVSDFYAAYHHYPGVKQRCWAHLLRDVHNLKVLYPEDTGLAQWAEAVHQLYTEAKTLVTSQVGQGPRAQLTLEEKLLALCRPFLNDPLAVQGKLCRRMERFIKELFVFVADPAVPPENNAAERSLRHLVTSRKISGGTRSAEGTNSKMTLSSLFGTWRARGLNVLLQCRQLLTSPQT
jgi:transposase